MQVWLASPRSPRQTTSQKTRAQSPSGPAAGHSHTTQPEILGLATELTPSGTRQETTGNRADSKQCIGPAAHSGGSLLQPRSAPARPGLASVTARAVTKPNGGHPMKLTDSQLVLLSRAAQRGDHGLELP